MAYVYALDPATPAGGEAASLGAGRIRDVKSAMIERVNSRFVDVDDDPWIIKSPVSGGNTESLVPTADNTNVLGTALLRFSEVQAVAFFGDGSNLTSLDAAELASGTVPNARLTGAYTGVTGLGVLAADLLFTDATYDVGKSGATRPRDGFFSRNLSVGGLLTLIGGQISFPATQVPSADANTLDDYEEGTWQPGIGGTTTYTGTREGRYIKIGRLVWVTGYFTINSIGSGNNAEIMNLPFTGANNVGRSGFGLGYLSGLKHSYVMLNLAAVANTTEAAFYGMTAAATEAPLTDAMQDGTVIGGFGGCYEAAA